jgi:hypothetical protein
MKIISHFFVKITYDMMVTSSDRCLDVTRKSEQRTYPGLGGKPYSEQHSNKSRNLE